MLTPRRSLSSLAAFQLRDLCGDSDAALLCGCGSLTCSNASSHRPRMANPGEKSSQRAHLECVLAYAYRRRPRGGRTCDYSAGP
jgi:hypothetical protein